MHVISISTVADRSSAKVIFYMIAVNLRIYHIYECHSKVCLQILFKGMIFLDPFQAIAFGLLSYLQIRIINPMFFF